MKSLIVAATVVGLGGVAVAAVPEGQPVSTAYPNHKSYVYGSDSQPYTQYHYDRGTSITTDDYYIFEPRNGSQTVTSAPVVVYIHGYGEDGPDKIDKMIRHLTRSGMTVVFPEWLKIWNGNAANFQDWVDKTHGSIADALVQLSGAGHVPVETDATGRPKVAFVAHSIGTYIATFVAEKAADDHLIPEPLALVYTDPAGWKFKTNVGIDITQIGNIDPNTDVVMLSAQGTLYDDQGAVEQNSQLAVQDFLDHLPVTCDRLSAWVVASDRDGWIELRSEHNDSATKDRFDAIDWWGYWPHLSAHLKHAFWGTYADFLHDGGSLFSGTWRTLGGAYVRDINPKFPHPLYPDGYSCP